MVGKGPRVLVKPKAGRHTVSAVIGGRQVEKAVVLPTDSHVQLTRP
jgi:hypothetical protein